MGRRLVTGLAGVRIGNVAESYYSARSRRDAEWRLRAITGALERERARREADYEAPLAASASHPVMNVT
jgi:hypothetical protein